MAIIYVFALIVSLILVIKTADIFVDNLVAIGEAKGISQIILGSSQPQQLEHPFQNLVQQL